MDGLRDVDLRLTLRDSVVYIEVTWAIDVPPAPTGVYQVYADLYASDPTESGRPEQPRQHLWKFDFPRNENPTFAMPKEYLTMNLPEPGTYPGIAVVGLPSHFLDEDPGWRVSWKTGPGGIRALNATEEPDEVYARIRLKAPHGTFEVSTPTRTVPAPGVRGA